MSFGYRLKQLRTAKKMTQTELGQFLNVTKSSISGYENGTRFPDQESLIKIAEVFGVTTDYLLGKDQKKASELSSEQLTIAAHIDDDVSEDEMKEILSFIDYIKKRDHSK